MKAAVYGLSHGLAPGYEREEAVALGVRLGMLIEAAVVLLRHLQAGREGVHVEMVETVVALLGIDEYQSHALVVIEIGSYEVDSPEVSDCEVAVARSVLALARIARRAQVDVGEEASHEGIHIMYSGRQNGILVRLKGGLFADDKTVFFPATLSFISKLNVPDGGLCI